MWTIQPLLGSLQREPEAILKYLIANTVAERSFENHVKIKLTVINVTN